MKDWMITVNDREYQVTTGEKSIYITRAGTVLGSAVRTTSRKGRHTLLDMGRTFTTVRGWMTDGDVITKITTWDAENGS